MENSDISQEENMAEAAVENPAARFFCHKCTREVNPILPDFSCPRCQSGFVEEVPQNPEPSEESDDEVYLPYSSDITDGNEEADPLSQVADLWNMLNFMRRPEEIGLNPSSSRGSQTQDGREGRFNASRPGPSRRPRLSRQTPNRRSHELETARLRTEGFLQQLVSTLSENTGLVPNASFPVFLNLHSNPGDYAWGRGGWNAIITQLINQLDGTGPPPLPKEKIDEIPIVYIVQEQVDKNLQCTVCMEDYKVGEPVRRLSCDHHFHNECIIPWLELHGTCPICRKLLNDSSSQENVFQSTTQSSSDSDMIGLPLTGSSQQANSGSSVSESEASRRNYNFNPNLEVYDFTEEFD